MFDAQGACVFGGIAGFFSGFGLCFTGMAWTFSHSPAAGVMKDGQFVPYGSDPTWMLLFGLGLLLLAAGLAGLLYSATETSNAPAIVELRIAAITYASSSDTASIA